MIPSITWAHIGDLHADPADDWQGITRLDAMPGDHDFEDGTRAGSIHGTPEKMRLSDRTIAGDRCLFLDIVSAGSDGPDFRIGAGQRRRIERALAESDDPGQIPLLFMHAIPSDLADGGETLDYVPSRACRAIGNAWPHVQLSPAGVRLQTRTHDLPHVPRPGTVAVVARVLGPDCNGCGW